MVYYTRWPVKGGEPVPEMILSDGTKMGYTRFGPINDTPLPSFEFEGIYRDTPPDTPIIPNPDLDKKALYSMHEMKVKRART